MKASLVAGILFALASPAIAAASGCDNRSSPEVLSVAEWTGEQIDGQFGPVIAVSVTLQNDTESGFRMLDGSISFTDRLDRQIALISIEKDAAIPAGGTYIQSGRYRSFTGEIERLARVVPADVIATACVSAAIQDDGEVVRFGSAPPRSTAPMTAGEKESLALAARRCWAVDPGSEASRVTVEVGFDMTAEGRVVGNSVRMVSSSGGSEAAVATAYESARRAILRCGADGFDLPAGKYEDWKSLIISFSPNDTRVR